MDDNDKMGSICFNPIIPMPKNGYVKLAVDARYFNSVTGLTSYSWHLEPVQMIMTEANARLSQ